MSVLIEYLSPSIAKISLNKAPVNTLTENFQNEIVQAIEEVEANEKCKAIILTSNLRVFCAGLDLQNMAFGSNEECTGMMKALNNMVLKFHTTRLAIIVAINGKAPAGGTVIALGGDYRIACANPTSGKPKFIMGLNEAQLNMPGTTWLPEHCAQVTGARNAERILCTGKMWTSEEALSLNLVDEVVSENQLFERAFLVAKEYASVGQESRIFFRQKLRAPIIRYLQDYSDIDVGYCTNLIVKLRPGFQKMMKESMKRKSKL